MDFPFTMPQEYTDLSSVYRKKTCAEVRHAFLMEIDPAYCDVIVQRWEGFTGKKAERIAVDDDGVAEEKSPIAIGAIEAAEDSS